MVSRKREGYSYKCVEKSCGEVKNGLETVSFFSIPTEPVRRAIWLENCELSGDNLTKTNLKVCGKHFEKHMFLNDLQNRLQPHAVPTLFLDRKDNQVITSSSKLVCSDSIERSTDVCGPVSCENTPLCFTAPDSSKICATETFCNNEILALPSPPLSPEMSSINKTFSPGTSTSYSSDNTSDSPVAFSAPNSSKGSQTLKICSEKTPRNLLLRAQLKKEKEARLKAEKIVINLSNQLTEFGTVEKFLSLCEKHLSPNVLTIVKSHMMCKTRNPHGYSCREKKCKVQRDRAETGISIDRLKPAIVIREDPIADHSYAVNVINEV